MSIIVTGNVNRPGQWTNVLSLYDAIAPHLEPLGYAPRLEMPRATRDRDWVKRHFNGPFPLPYIPDLLIGFELPPCAKLNTGKWIDVRRHPYRWTDEPVFSIQCSFSVDLSPFRQLMRHPEIYFPISHNLRNAGGFACQVHNDSAMIRGESFVTPDAVMDQIMKFASEFERFLILPHPKEPSGLWPTTLCERVPNAEYVDVSSYRVLPWLKALMTYSSSLGAEAAAFRCPRVEWLGPPLHVEPPVQIDNHDLWAHLLSCAGIP